MPVTFTECIQLVQSLYAQASAKLRTHADCVQSLALKGLNNFTPDRSKSRTLRVTNINVLQPVIKLGLEHHREPYQVSE